MDLTNMIRVATRVLRTVSQISRAVDSTRTSGGSPSRPPTPSARNVRGDFDGCPRMDYRATLVGGHRTGEVVWTWIPFEDDPSQGKDRPALVLADDGTDLLVTPATSKDHDRDEAQELRAGRYWMDIGTGSWDSKGRPSEVRLDRIVRVHPSTIRRRSGRISARIFDQVAAGIREHWDD